MTKGKSPMKSSAKVGIGDPAYNNIASASLPADKVQYVPTGIKTEIGSLKAGPAYYDLDKGRHCNFLHIPANYVSRLPLRRLFRRGDPGRGREGRLQ
jgi:hypothetical protein